MSVIILSILGVNLLGLAVVMFAAGRSPYGYEDEEGFHNTGTALPPEDLSARHDDSQSSHEHYGVASIR